MQRKSMTFNGVRKPWLILRKGRVKSPFAPIVNNLLTVTGRPGAYIESSRAGVLYISQPFAFVFKNDAHKLELMDELASWLITDKPVELGFDDEPGRTYYAKIDGGIEDFERYINLREGTITFVCADPFSYGPEKTLSFPADIVVVENKGTAEADPIFELTATKKTTFAMISNGDDENAEYNLIGKPADVDETIVDEKTPIFDELGDTTSAWSTPSGFDKGIFKSDSNGIFVDSYGTGDGWHGPGLIREIDPIEDFEIEFLTSVRTESPQQTFRLSTNFFDENMNELGLLRVWNKSTSKIAKIIEARIGPYVSKFENYLISSDNYNWDGQRVYNGIIRVTRKGNEYTFYAAHISQRGNHIESITETYRDVNNEYAGKLKFIRIDAAIYGNNPLPNELSITRVRVSRHNKILVDETPYILDVGDKITFDHKDDDLLINGEPRNDLKNFGGSFFTLKKGENMLLVTPEDSFDAKVTFSDKYL